MPTLSHRTRPRSTSARESASTRPTSSATITGLSDMCESSLQAGALLRAGIAPEAGIPPCVRALPEADFHVASCRVPRIRTLLLSTDGGSDHQPDQECKQHERHDSHSDEHGDTDLGRNEWWLLHFRWLAEMIDEPLDALDN